MLVGDRAAAFLVNNPFERSAEIAPGEPAQIKEGHYFGHLGERRIQSDDRRG
jgi:hypothetical protein